MTGTGAFIDYCGVLLYTDLIRRFGPDMVFLDAESLPAGDDDVREQLVRVRSASVVLAVIGPGRLTATDADGLRAIDNPRDWIRHELAAAFAAGLRAVPVLVDGAALPAAAELPGDIAELGRCQARSVRRRELTTDLERLATELTEVGPAFAATGTRTSALQAVSMTANTGSGDPADNGSGIRDLWYDQGGNLNMTYTSWRCDAFSEHYGDRTKIADEVLAIAAPETQ